MNKDNVLFGVIGLLLGLIIGFFFANSVNQRGLAGRGPGGAGATAGLPPDHPALEGSGAADQAGMQPAVKAVLDKARNEPNNLEAQMQAAQMYVQVQQFDQALELLMRANQIQPENYQVIVALGNTNFDSQNYEAAEKWYSVALAKKPDDVNVLTDRGLTFMFKAQPDYDRAVAEFRKALQYQPKHEQTLQNIVVALTEKKDVKEAQAMLDKLIEASPQNPAIPELRRKLDTLKSGAPASTAK
jgi:tetratricopeptide (TPR) repeat protein